MSSTEMRRLKKVMLEIMPAIAFTATTDKKVALKAEVADRLQKLFEPPAPVATPAPTATPGISPQMAQRYGRAAAPAPAAPVAPPRPVKTNDIPYLVYSAQGSWERHGDKYRLSVQDEKGKSHNWDANADEERLSIATQAVTLVFAKAD